MANYITMMTAMILIGSEQSKLHKRWPIIFIYHEKQPF